MRLVRHVKVVVAIVAATFVCAGSASAAPGDWTTVTIRASDATPLACAYIVPPGTAPAGGWPGVIIFHGLGQSYDEMEPYGTALAGFGFASLACDARGTGASGGTFGLDGPKEVQDARDLFSWFAGRDGVSKTQIGALGLSLGGGEVLNAAVAGVPFKAIVPAATWTNLAAALDPDGVPKFGLLKELFLDVPLSGWDPTLLSAAENLLDDNISAAAVTAEAARSSRSKLHSLKVPTLLLQGRHDFLFDMDQAISAYKLLAGPKRLYLGDIGHAPAKNPAAEVPTYLGQVVSWFDEYLDGGASLPRGRVELAHDPWDGTTTSYKGIPATRHKIVNLPGKTKLSLPGAFSTRAVRLTGGPLETFGDGFVTVRYSKAHQWGSLIATITVKGGSTPVTYGAAPVPAKAGVLRIPLSDQAVLLPRGKRLVVRIGGGIADSVYGPALPPNVGGNTVTIGRVTLDLSLLDRAVSR